MAKKFNDPKMCGAWRCNEFSCGNYSDSDYDCNNNLCHVCATGQKCLNCDNFEDCEFGKDNMKIQKMRNSKGQSKMSKEEAVLILEKAGYTAKVENSVVVAKIEKFSQKEFDRVRKILREAGYNSSFGVKNWKEGEKNVPGEEKEI